MAEILVRPDYTADIARGGQRPRIHPMGKASQRWCLTCKQAGRDPWQPVDHQHFRGMDKHRRPLFPLVATNLGPEPVYIESAAHYKRECAKRGVMCRGL